MTFSLPWIALGLAVFCTLLWRPLPRSRGRFRAAFGFLSLWLLLWAGASVASYWGLEARTAQQLAAALIELAAVQAAAGIAFDFAVEKTRVPRFAAEMVVVACYILICLNVFYNLGVNVTGIFATSAVAAAVLGLALQDMLANIASGVALEFESDVQVGDFIRCGDASGWVQHVRLRHTAIETPDGDRILLPNSFLTRSSLTIVPRLRRLFVPFTMPYARNPQEMIEAVTAGLRASPIPHVAAEPAPFCIILEMAPGHIRYAAVVRMVRPGEDPMAMSAVLNRLYFALERAGVPPSEITTLLEMKADTDGRGERANPVDILRGTPIFRLLSDPELYELGASLHGLSFAPGEFIIRQGDDGECMYFVTAGQVAITYTGAHGTEHEVARIDPGEFFGEMSLLTGETRNSNAVARSRVDCYRLDKPGLQGIITGRMDLAEDISAVIAHREMQLAGVRERLDLETTRQREVENQLQLLGRIRRFFGMTGVSARV